MKKSQSYVKLEDLLGVETDELTEYPFSLMSLSPYDDFGFFDPKNNSYENCKEIAATNIAFHSGDTIVKVGKPNSKKITASKLKLIRAKIAKVERGTKRKTVICRVYDHPHLLVVRPGPAFRNYIGATYLLSIMRATLGYGNKSDKFIVHKKNEAAVFVLVKNHKKASKLRDAVYDLPGHDDEGEGIGGTLELVDVLRKILPSIFK